MRRFGFVIGRTVANRFDSYIHKGKVMIKKSRVGSIILLQLVYILGEELECGRGSDVCRVLASEFHKLVIEGGHHLNGEASHDVLDQNWSDGNAVEVFHIVELLDDLQVGQQGLDLGSQIFSDLLDRFVARKEVKYLIDVAPKMSMLPNSSMSLALKLVQSLMELNEPLLFNGMAWRVRSNLAGLLHLVRVNLLRAEDNQG